MLLYQKIKLFYLKQRCWSELENKLVFSAKKIYLVVCTERHSFFVLCGKLLFLFMKFKQHQKICTI